MKYRVWINSAEKCVVSEDWGKDKSVGDEFESVLEAVKFVNGIAEFGEDIVMERDVVDAIVQQTKHMIVFN